VPPPGTKSSADLRVPTKTTSASGKRLSIASSMMLVILISDPEHARQHVHSAHALRITGLTTRALGIHPRMSSS